MYYFGALILNIEYNIVMWYNNAGPLPYKNLNALKLFKLLVTIQIESPQLSQVQLNDLLNHCAKSMSRATSVNTVDPPCSPHRYWYYLIYYFEIFLTIKV